MLLWRKQFPSATLWSPAKNTGSEHEKPAHEKGHFYIKNGCCFAKAALSLLLPSQALLFLICTLTPRETSLPNVHLDAFLFALCWLPAQQQE